MDQNENNMKKIKINSIWSLVYTIILLISGFILPRLIIYYYGSEVNGLVNSINQFLQVFTFLELGVAAVTKTSLYSSIAKNDFLQTNKIVSSASKFYRSIGRVLVVYILILIMLYPQIINEKYSAGYIAILIIAHSASLFAQYYFGVVDTCILDAYQKIYIYYMVQTASVIINIFLSITMIIYGFSICSVKIMTALIYIFRPVIIRTYINCHYKINRYEKYSEDPIREKWNGVAQHISFIVLQSTDTVSLTFFSTLLEVSVYSVYNLVISGINSLITALFLSVAPFMGNLYANNEKKALHSFFKNLNLGLHCLVIIMFSCTNSLIMPFVLIYTKGVNDVNYLQPVFSFIIVLANAWFCLRLPYALLIQAIGGYKGTQNTFVAAAVINVLISISLIHSYGLIGVGIGTLVAMIYQTTKLAVYTGKNVLQEQTLFTVKIFLWDMFEIIIIYVISKLINLGELTYISWIIMAIKIFFIAFIVVFSVQLLFNRSAFIMFLNALINKGKTKSCRERNDK